MGLETLRTRNFAAYFSLPFREKLNEFEALIFYASSLLPGQAGSLTETERF